MLPGWVVAEAVILALATALSAAVMHDDDPLIGDQAVTDRVQAVPAFHTVARVFRWGMGTEGVLLVGAAAALALWLAHRRWEGAGLVTALLVMRIAQPLIKNVVDRERPSEDLVERRGGFSSESFPSGHMMSSAVLCGMLLVIVWRLGLPRPAAIASGLVLAATVTLNGASSLYMGVHWPSDVAGGLLWAAAIVVPAATFLRSRPR
jgi:undecaprenyl-diphosphatase